MIEKTLHAVEDIDATMTVLLKVGDKRRNVNDLIRFLFDLRRQRDVKRPPVETIPSTHREVHIQKAYASLILLKDALRHIFNTAGNDGRPFAQELIDAFNKNHAEGVANNEEAKEMVLNHRPFDRVRAEAEGVQWQVYIYGNDGGTKPLCISIL